MALVLSAIGIGASASPAAAAPVYEITGRWVDAPPTIARGNPVVAEWRVNVNDNMPAPSNAPVDNVTATFTVDKAFFDEVPDICRTTGVTPVSRISPDGTRLTCNFGTVNMGTALVVQTPVVANGTTGEFVRLHGTSPSGETVELPPIQILNPFVMDSFWTGVSQYLAWNDVSNPQYVDVDLEWSLRLGRGSDPGPQTVTYRLNVATQDGSPVQVGVHPTGVGQPENYGVPGCTEFDLAAADGHPWSHAPGHPRSTSFVDSCTLTAVPGQPGVFDLTLSGINYDLVTAPRLDSYGNPLPPNWDTVASGTLWFRVITTQSGSISLQASAPTYTAPTGQRFADLPGNNVSNKVYPLPGGFSAAYLREYTGNGGTRWDDTYRVSTGTTVWTYVANHMAADNVDPAARYGVCQVLQPQFVDFNPAERIEFWLVTEVGTGINLGDDPPGLLEYYTGPVGDPDDFLCDTGTWTTTQPADPAAVTAVRLTYPHSRYSELDAIGIQMRLPTRIQDNVPIGQDVWTFGSYLRNGTWVSDANYGVLTPTPGYQYPHTNGRRDVLVVVLATPFIEKRAARSTVTPGVPADFTLTYSATGSGSIPPTVDGYVIRDVLPLGMTYHPGSATPAPVVSTDAQGRQVLTWTLNGVQTNVEHTLTYQAVADRNLPPGRQLTNTAVSSLAGESSAPVTETVTTTSNGYTEIGKSADTPFIPNLTGEGDGEGVWTVTLRSFDPLPQPYTDTIDILPFEGDARGTEFEGEYSLVAVEPMPGGQVFYTTADLASLSDDPAHPSNGAPSNPVGNTVGWSPVFTPDATAVRVIGPGLEPGATQAFRVRIATDGAEGEDVFVNRAQARAGHTELVMRTSAPMTVANYYSAALKKYVMDRAGRWRDANEVADYPTFRYGDTVRYRIVVTNTGQGTLTNLEVSDDQQPALGNFTVASLAPGEQASHEFELVLEESVDGTVVNTASATADVPRDSQVPPTINTDPAGFEVANYTTVKSADPAAGELVYPGQRVRYTVRVTQQGSAPAQAVFSDDLAEVLDDARYNGDVATDVGTVAFRGGHIVWAGTIPVGGVATVTYSVTVRGLEHLGDRRLVNPVTSPGCEVRAGRTLNCRTEHRVGRFDLALDKRVVSGPMATVGDRVRYRLQVSNRGPAASPSPVTVTDRLPRGLELRSARGRGWECQVRRAADTVRCVRDRAVQADRKAPPVFVVATATRQALGGRLVNTARVGREGDTVRRNNRDSAVLRVLRVPPLPSTGFRLPTWLRGGLI